MTWRGYGLTLDEVYAEATRSPSLRKYGTKKWFRAVHKAVESTRDSRGSLFGKPVVAIGSTFTVRYRPEANAFEVSEDTGAGS
jgi:hypothetical protein